VTRLFARAAVAALLLACAVPAVAQGPAPVIQADAAVALPDLPPIGKWMIDRDGSIAHWLGEIYEGKRLFEPVNVIVVDEAAVSVDNAVERLLEATIAAGYPVRFGHSAGYRGFIGGKLYTQLPRGRDDAFSNRLFEKSNNHGRIFGPHRFGSSYVFIGAFSRESVNILRWPEHRFASFNVARDDLAQRLAAKTSFGLAGVVALGNALRDDPSVSTGDHDGNAVVLRAKK
jgi:hypothetical protein